MLLYIAKLRIENFVILPLFFFDLLQICLQFYLGLLCQLGLEHEAALSSLVEKVGTVSEAIIAELLSDALSVGTLGAFLDEVVQEAQDFKVKALKAVIFVVVQLLSNGIVIALEEILTLLIGSLLVFHSVELILLRHLLLQLLAVRLLDFTDCSLVEHLHGLGLGLLEDLLELHLEHGAPVAELVVEQLLEHLVSVHHRLVALVFANVAPAGFDRWHSASIDGVHVRLGQVEKHLTVERLLVKLLGLDTVEHFAAQGVHLLHELGAQVLKGDVCKVLKLVLIGEGPDHGAAVALFEETFEEAPNSIFLVDRLAEAFLILQRLLQVVF